MMHRPQLFHLDHTHQHDPAIAPWLCSHREDLDAIAQHWWSILRTQSDELREALHDNCPTACLGTAAFAYINVFTAHVAIGFFNGSTLHDPAKLLQGTGKFMRHVKLSPAKPTNEAALQQLIAAALADIKSRVEHG